MFNLLKKAKENKVVVKKYTTEIEKVHHEFECAGDTLYEESLNTINSINIGNTCKVDRLKKLGFINSKEVTEFNKKIENKKISEELAKTVEYFRMNYPFNKFITKEQVIFICKKYGLIYGEIFRFKGFVPENKLKEIENFSLKLKDIMYKIGSKSTYGRDEGQIIWDNGDRVKEYSNIYKKCKEKENLYIIAPPEDFDKKGMQIENYKLTRIIPDPVVIQPVKGGYLIVTAWGDESSDDEVVNHINN